MNKYEVIDHQTYALTGEGERELLANFSAAITQETRFVDGRSTETVLTINGGQLEPPDEETGEREYTPFPPAEVPSANFPAMTWVLQNWGVRAVIMPGSGVKEDLRTHIQLSSRPTIRTIYKHIGWTTLNKKPAYLHAGGAITAQGNDPSVTVRLPLELNNYDLTPTPGVDLKDAIEATLSLVDLGPPSITWPMLIATFAPLFCETDFAMHLTGRTGTFKSEVISLFQSHFGTKMDARHLPGSWSSTPNALEAQAYYAKNAPFVVDDFVPTGTSWQVKAYQTTADKIIRSQGNQSGRARLTDTSGLQTTMYPRGIILSTGEDTPEGHSVRARMLILELSPGDIEAPKLSEAQRKRPLYTTTTAALIQHLCQGKPAVNELADEYRKSHLDVGHSRTPSALACLVAVSHYFLEWCSQVLGMTSDDLLYMQRHAERNILEAANRQNQYLEAADPCEIFCQTIRNVTGAGLGHFRTLLGGIPGSPTMLGWTEENSLSDVPTFRSHGPCIGWIDWTADELFLDIAVGLNILKKVAGSDMVLTKQTLIKRLKDSGLLSRTDDARQRNTIRITAEKHPRQVIAMAISHVFQTQEKPNDE